MVNLVSWDTDTVGLSKNSANNHLHNWNADMKHWLFVEADDVTASATRSISTFTAIQLRPTKNPHRDDVMTSGVIGFCYHRLSEALGKIIYKQLPIGSFLSHTCIKSN